MEFHSRSWWFSIFLVIFLISTSNGLYEDQIKKFDWRVLNIGKLRDVHFELNSMQPRLLVSTEENVIASLCPKSGELLWRQVLEIGERGNIKHFEVTTIGDAGNTAAAGLNSKHGFDMLTVQGQAPALIRGWNSNTGTIEWEWSLMPLQADRAYAAFWFYSNSILYHVIPVWNSHLEVTEYFATTGNELGSTSKITAPWINEKNCFLSGVYYVCIEGNQMISLDLHISQPQIIRRSLSFVPQKFDALKGANGIVVVDKQLMNVLPDGKVCGDLKSNSFVVGSFNWKRVLVQADVVNNNLQIQAFYEETCEEVAELSNSLLYPENYGVPVIKSIDCKNKRNNDGKGCLFLLSTEDGAILAVQQNKLRWVREEALANVVASEFIDLPLADAEGTLESEMKEAGDILSAFMRRISTQMVQIKIIFLHVLGLGPAPSDTQKAGLVRDSFGLHKMLVVLTRSGKLFGIDNISGKHHWQRYLENASGFANNQNMRLLVQRTSKHFPFEPLCTVVAQDKSSGNTILFRFNPITGKPTEGGLQNLGYKIKQMALLAESDSDFTKGILVVDPTNNVHVFPESAMPMAHGMYIYTADLTTASLNGFYVKKNGKQLKTIPVWNVYLGGQANEHKIIALASKNPIERVHSQGRVLSDRSVLYKYINPNLVAVITQANDSIHKYILNVYLIDVVSGSVVFSMTHRKARGPVQMVHSENWLAYSYYNDKVRRTEITTVELYEGKTQTNSTVWSSLSATPMPLVERNSYIFPAIVEAMRETITERGITNKHVLIGTASGAILEMPWALLDPRRPASPTQGREEGTIPYIPELPIPTENIINYNQTIARLNHIYTAPSGLESTCLVVATGLDIFVTRVAPSKTFDLLKEDFDYFLISIVLLTLTTGSLVVRHLASKKTLKQAWK